MPGGDVVAGAVLVYARTCAGRDGKVEIKSRPRFGACQAGRELSMRCLMPDEGVLVDVRCRERVVNGPSD